MRGVGSALVDIANTGRPVRLLLMETSLRQPDLCTVQLHELVGMDGHRLVDAAERAELQKLGVEADDPSHPDADCHDETHYLVQGHRTLVESRDHAQSEPASPEGRRITINERGRWREVCAIRSVSRWLVQPAAKAQP